ncbi:hypothetical protein SCLARK_001288 [Spiroplasma clarkii]|uniref:Single-stranded DNA-binding protein n=1 Tax=Spiroplasma clarkii TaxID=2139 RepID=A0A1Y0L283_9MOLU|nr:hypothetical protein [Spiroplasma clarkii]ARU91828.1 hypothetical protein SCLARK_001288 [Spiroplasma clarkii]ATX71190.1 hypothetical protein SCLAR_v1c08820 [Spiroplasma clarkii]
MNLFIGIGYITNISELKKSQANTYYVSATLWTNNIGIEKEQKDLMVMFQAFDELGLELDKTRNTINPGDRYIVLGFAKIDVKFKGITVQRIIKVNNESDIDSFFKTEFWKML